MNVLNPGEFRFRSRARRGPSKSPDFIAEDSEGELSVIECKGSQSSIAALSNAVECGRDQKQNVVPRSGRVLRHRLVCGAYVPQWQSREEATILIADPEWTDISSEFDKHPSDTLRRAVRQVAYAKELATFDLVETAGVLVRDDVDDNKSPQDALERDLARLGKISVRQRTVEFSHIHYWRLPLRRDGSRFTGIRFSGKLDLDRLEPIRPSKDVEVSGDLIFEATSKLAWTSITTKFGAQFTSPIGAVYEVEWLRT